MNDVVNEDTKTTLRNGLFWLVVLFCAVQSIIIMVLAPYAACEIRHRIVLWAMEQPEMDVQMASISQQNDKAEMEALAKSVDALPVGKQK